MSKKEKIIPNILVSISLGLALLSVILFTVFVTLALYSWTALYGFIWIIPFTIETLQSYPLSSFLFISLAFGIAISLLVISLVKKVKIGIYWSIGSLYSILLTFVSLIFSIYFLIGYNPSENTYEDWRIGLVIALLITSLLTVLLCIINYIITMIFLNKKMKNNDAIDKNSENVSMDTLSENNNEEV